MGQLHNIAQQQLTLLFVLLQSPAKSSGSAANAAGFAAVVQESEVAVKVAVVARPLLPFELEKGAASHAQVLPPNKVCHA
jgi:hypothetical protein